VVGFVSIGTPFAVGHAGGAPTPDDGRRSSDEAEEALGLPADPRARSIDR
jgi:hypothetical protein